jgi:hypothetical protein
MTPFMTAANGPLWPKSVVIVMTPEGLNFVIALHTAEDR